MKNLLIAIILVSSFNSTAQTDSTEITISFIDNVTILRDDSQMLGYEKSKDKSLKEHGSNIVGSIIETPIFVLDHLFGIFRGGMFEGSSSRIDRPLHETQLYLREDLYQDITFSTGDRFTFKLVKRAKNYFRDALSFINTDVHSPIEELFVYNDEYLNHRDSESRCEFLKDSIDSSGVMKLISCK